MSQLAFVISLRKAWLPVKYGEKHNETVAVAIRNHNKFFWSVFLIWETYDENPVNRATSRTERHRNVTKDGSHIVKNIDKY